MSIFRAWKKFVLGLRTLISCSQVPFSHKRSWINFGEHPDFLAPEWKLFEFGINSRERSQLPASKQSQPLFLEFLTNIKTRSMSLRTITPSLTIYNYSVMDRQFEEEPFFSRKLDFKNFLEF